MPVKQGPSKIPSKTSRGYPQGATPKASKTAMPVPSKSQTKVGPGVSEPLKKIASTQTPTRRVSTTVAPVVEVTTSTASSVSGTGAAGDEGPISPHILGWLPAIGKAAVGATLMALMFWFKGGRSASGVCDTEDDFDCCRKCLKLHPVRKKTYLTRFEQEELRREEERRKERR